MSVISCNVDLCKAHMNEWKNTDQIISSHQLTQSGLLSAISLFYSTFFSSSQTLLQLLSERAFSP
ncbi:hypothetical protein DPMN_124398 [Dreissena polymorpha]|uniref:Uncharacterized protein n=1 Tax=Dreissena polymorpha TaxID=45954 RepID=A0A9D4GTG1_DREPO|nr:hypothetical protein DPMN_124398 [Dreissena polymorpha]